MKKNITINLCGRLFQIDEDAYEMLQHYMDSLRSHFGRQEGGDEIANDIEARIAELFDELKGQGVAAITIDHVKDIITRIGKPEDFTDEEDEPNHERTDKQRTYENAHTKTTPKRLYRNPNDKMLAGVMSGLAAYTNTDVTFWRLGAVLFTFFYGTGLLLYIILAIVLPQANTPEEQLRMKGKEVNPRNLADEVVDNKQSPRPQSSGLREVFSILLKIVFAFFIGIAIFVGGILAIAFLGLLVTCAFALFAPMTLAINAPFTLKGMGLVEVWQMHPAVLIFFAIALLVVLFVPVYAIVHMVLSLTKKVQPMSMTQRVAWVVIWIVALCAAIPLGGAIGMLHEQYENERLADIGGWMTDYDRDYLKSHGWTLQKHENCHNDYVKSGEYFTGDEEKDYLDVWDANCKQLFQVEQLQLVDSGYNYRISCNARAAGDGVYVYAYMVSSPDEVVLAKVPAYGNQGGLIWEKAHEDVNNDTLSLSLKQRAKDILEVNDGKGYGWSPVELLVYCDKPGTICYGLSTDPKFTGKSYQSEWFSACDFKVEPLEKKQ